MAKEQREYPIDPRGLDDILWELLIRQHNVFDELLNEKPVQSEWLKRWFNDLKSKLLEPNLNYHEQAKESPQEAEKTTRVKGKKRTNY